MVTLQTECYTSEGILTLPLTLDQINLCKTKTRKYIYFLFVNEVDLPEHLQLINYILSDDCAFCPTGNTDQKKPFREVIHTSLVEKIFFFEL